MDLENQKDKLIKLIGELSESIDYDSAKKIDIKLFESVGQRLIQYYDECKVCQENTCLLLRYAEETNNFTNLQNKQVLLDYHRTIKAIVSHLESEHRLISEGQYMSFYMSIGMALGAGLGAAFNNIAIGVSLGLCLGLAIGVCVDADYRKKGRII